MENSLNLHGHPSQIHYTHYITHKYKQTIPKKEKKKNPIIKIKITLTEKEK